MGEKKDLEQEIGNEELADMLAAAGAPADAVQLQRWGLEDILFVARMGPGSSVWHPVAGKYVTFKDEPQRYMRFVLGINEACGFHSHQDARELGTSSPSPLGVSYLFKRFKPQAEAVLEGLSLQPVEAPDLVEETEWNCLQEITAKAQVVLRVLEDLRSILRDEGIRIRDDGTPVFDSEGGRPRHYVNRVIERLYRLLQEHKEGGIAGSPRFVLEDIQALLTPLVGISREQIRGVTDKL